MHDQDRADKLAKAIEEMVQGRMPKDLDDEDLQQLLQIAKISPAAPPQPTICRRTSRPIAKTRST
jgi:hypothetical protein